MKVKQANVAVKAQSDNLNDLIIDAIQDIKGQEIVKLDLTQLEDASADYYIICQGESTTQVNAIADNVKKRIKEEKGTHPSHVEGILESKWILIDYFDTVVHIFYPETRAYYDIEDLWGDAEVSYYQNL